MEEVDEFAQKLISRVANAGLREELQAFLNAIKTVSLNDLGLTIAERTLRLREQGIGTPFIPMTLFTMSEREAKEAKAIFLFRLYNALIEIYRGKGRR